MNKCARQGTQGGCRRNEECRQPFPDSFFGIFALPHQFFSFPFAYTLSLFLLTFSSSRLNSFQMYGPSSIYSARTESNSSSSKMYVYIYIKREGEREMDYIAWRSHVFSRRRRQPGSRIIIRRNSCQESDSSLLDRHAQRYATLFRLVR